MNILLIGVGRLGFSYINGFLSCAKDIDSIYFVDTSLDACDKAVDLVSSHGIDTRSSLSLNDFRGHHFDLVCDVALSNQRFERLKYLNSHISYNYLIAEKVLVNSVEQSEQLQAMFKDKPHSYVNTCRER